MAILIPNYALAEKIGRRVEIDATTVEELLAAGTARFGELFGQAAKSAMIVVNGRSINSLQGGRTPLTASDTVWLLLPSSGG
jgi:molybdopterin converting factor small subunit